MTMCSQLLTIKRYTIYVLVSIWLSIDSEAAIEITLAGLKQPFCFCSVDVATIIQYLVKPSPLVSFSLELITYFVSLEVQDSPPRLLT